MVIRNIIKTRSGAVCGAAFVLCWAMIGTTVHAADMKLEALLVWGTNEQKSPDPDHKPVGPALKKRLQDLPLKWTNYFEVKSVRFDVPPSGAKKVPLGKCEIDVKNQGHDKIEVAVFGKSRQVAKQNRDLPKNGTLILGGDSPGTNCWLAVIRRLD